MKKTPSKKENNNKKNTKTIPKSKNTNLKTKIGKKNTKGYGMGSVDVVISVDQVNKAAATISTNAPKSKELNKLSKNNSFLTIENLKAGYGNFT